MPVKFSNVEGGVCIKNREMLNIVNGTQNWNTQYNQQVVVSNVLLFPWLAGIAAKFDKYRIKSLSWEFVTRLGTAVSSSAVQGSSQFTFIYDADDTVPTSYSTMMDTKYSQEKVLHQNHHFRFRPETALFTEYFVNHSGETDLTSPGYIMFSTFGLSADTANIGSLYVSYEIELFLPRVNPESVLSGDHQSWVGALTGTTMQTNWGSTSITTGKPLAAVVNTSPGVYGIYFAQPGIYTTHVMVTTTSTTTTAAISLTTTQSSPGDAWTTQLGSNVINDTVVGSSLVMWNCVNVISYPISQVVWTNGSLNPAGSNSPGSTFHFTIGNSSAQTFFYQVYIICHSTYRTGPAVLPLNSQLKKQNEIEAAVARALEKYNSSKDEVELSMPRLRRSDDDEDYDIPSRPPRLIRSDVCLTCKVDLELCKCSSSRMRLYGADEVPPAPTPSRAGSKK